MDCALAHAGDPGASCQTVILVRSTASAWSAPAGPAASVAVPGGSAGSARHRAPGPATVWPRLPLSMIAVVSLGPKDAELSAAPFSRSGGDRTQWLPPSEDQAASRLAAGPVPAASSAMVLLAVLVSLSTWTGWLAKAAGSAGPAACQVPPVAAKMPAVPGWLHVPPSSGCPDGLNAAAVRFCSPQLRPGGVAPRDRCVAMAVQLV
jgi:hypothetical protein